jgi:hypothetical protein
LKRARWTVLTSNNNLSESGVEVLNEILKSHRVLATCYAMKEEMNRLFELRDRDEAYYGWTKWFTAAKESGIPQLQKFGCSRNDREIRIEKGAKILAQSLILWRVNSKVCKHL